MSEAWDDDDRLDELSPLEDLEGDEEVGTGEAELGIELDTDGDGEEVGLDDSTGGAEVFDVAALLGEMGTGDEGERWTEGSEDVGELVADDGLEGEEDEEYGWTEDTEAPALEGWDEDLFHTEEEAIVGDDAGEEGVEEELSLGGDGDDAMELPPLEAGGEDGDELAEDLELAEEAEIDGAELSYEEEARLSGAALPPPLSPAQLGVSHLGPSDDALSAVAVAGQALFGAGERLYVPGPGGAARGALEALGAAGLEAQDLTSLALDPRAPHRLVVGTRLGGAFRSTDGGAGFAPVNGWVHGDDASRLSVAFFVAAQPHGGGVRLWGRTRAGALYRSDDFGDAWSRPLLPAPVAALGIDPEGAVLALCVPRNGAARLARSTDGGHAWTMREVGGLLPEPPPADADHHVAALGPLLAVARDREAGGPFLSRDAGATWERLAGLPSAGPLCFVREAGAAVLYAALFFDGADRGVVVRQPLADPGAPTPAPALVLDVRAERDRRRIEGRGDPEGDNRVGAIVAVPEGPRTRLYVASGAGLFRVDVRA